MASLHINSQNQWRLEGYFFWKTRFSSIFLHSKNANISNFGISIAQLATLQFLFSPLFLNPFNWFSNISIIFKSVVIWHSRKQDVFNISSKSVMVCKNQLEYVKISKGTWFLFSLFYSENRYRNGEKLKKVILSVQFYLFSTRVDGWGSFRRKITWLDLSWLPKILVKQHFYGNLEK